MPSHLHRYDGDAGAAHAAFFDNAVSRVVDELEALAVFVDEGLRAVGRVVGQGDRALFGVLAGHELAACIERKVGVAAQASVQIIKSGQWKVSIRFR